MQQSNINRCAIYTGAMFNKENCTLIKNVYNITFVRRAEHFSSSDFARMERGAEQKHGKWCEQNTYGNVADETIGTDPSVFFSYYTMDINC